MPLLQVNNQWTHSMNCGVRVRKRWLYERSEGHTSVYDFECMPCNCGRAKGVRIALWIATAAVGFLIGALIQ